MEDTGEPVDYLSSSDILTVNRRIILETGGFAAGAGVPRDRGSLDYAVEAVQARLGGQQLYPTLAQKAAFYAYHLNTAHVFLDGNKRTSMACALWFLRRNGCRIRASLADEEIVRAAIAIARGSMRFDDVVGWIEALIS